MYFAWPLLRGSIAQREDTASIFNPLLFDVGGFADVSNQRPNDVRPLHKHLLKDQHISVISAGEGGDQAGG